MNKGTQTWVPLVNKLYFFIPYLKNGASLLCKRMQRIKDSKSQSVKNNKETKDLRFRLAETEHEPVVRTPLVAGSRPTAEQPQTAAAACQLEDARVDPRVGDLLHAYINPFIQRLVTILQTIIGTGIGRTQFQSEILSTLIDLISRGTALESKIGDGKSNKRGFFRIFTRHEFPIIEHSFCVVGNVYTGRLHFGDKLLCGLPSYLDVLSANFLFGKGRIHMFEILRQFLKYAWLKLAYIGFGIFIYLARHVSDLVSGAFKYDKHIFLGISSLAKFVDTWVFLISEAFDSSVDFVQQNKIILGECFLVLTLFLKSGEHPHVFAFLAVCVRFSSELLKFAIKSFLHDRLHSLMRKNSSYFANPIVSVHANSETRLSRFAR